MIDQIKTALADGACESVTAIVTKPYCKDGSITWKKGDESLLDDYW